MNINETTQKILDETEIALRRKLWKAAEDYDSQFTSKHYGSWLNLLRLRAGLKQGTFGSDFVHAELGRGTADDREVLRRIHVAMSGIPLHC